MIMKMPLMIVLNNLTKRKKNKKKICINLLCFLNLEKVIKVIQRNQMQMIIIALKGKVRNK